MYGKKLRLSRLINNSSKNICIVPIDHGTTLGSVKGIENYIQTITNAMDGGADAVVVHKGILERVAQYPELSNMKYIMHLSVSTILGNNPSYKVLVGTVEEAIKLGADAVSVHINLGVNDEQKMIEDFGMVSKACMEWGMPLLAMAYNHKNMEKSTGIAHAARLADELGADIIKVEYPGNIEDFSHVIDSVRIPVVMSGGAATDAKSLLVNIHNSMKAGGSGVAIGRNIFQHDNPKLMSSLISDLVHGRASLEECLSRL